MESKGRLEASPVAVHASSSKREGNLLVDLGLDHEGEDLVFTGREFGKARLQNVEFVAPFQHSFAPVAGVRNRLQQRCFCNRLVEKGDVVHRLARSTRDLLNILAAISEAGATFLRVSPCDLRVYLWMAFVGFAKLFEGADAEAVTWLRRFAEANRNYALAHYFATALAHLGELDEARAVAQAGIALNPGFTIRRYRDAAPPQTQFC